MEKIIADIDSAIHHIQNKGYNSAIILLNAIKKDFESPTPTEPEGECAKCKYGIKGCVHEVSAVCDDCIPNEYQH